MSARRSPARMGCCLRQRCCRIDGQRDRKRIRCPKRFRTSNPGARAPQIGGSTTMEMRSRHTIRKAPPGNQAPRYIEPWIYPEAKADTTLAKLEVAFRTAL